MLRNVRPREVLLQCPINVRVQLIQMKPNLLQHRLRVRPVNRMLPPLNHDAMQLPGVRHVEVPHHHQTLRRPVAPPHVGMTSPLAKRPGRPIPQMPHQNLPAVIKKLPHHLRPKIPLLILPVVIVKMPPHVPHIRLPRLVKHIVQRVLLRGPQPEHVRLPQRHVQLAASNPRSVMPAIPLLRHQRIQLVKAPQS